MLRFKDVQPGAYAQPHPAPTLECLTQLDIPALNITAISLER